MDPVSAIGGLVVAVGTTIGVIVGQVNAIRDGPTHVRDLFEDIQNFEHYLRNAGRILEGGWAPNSITSQTARDLIQIIKQTKQELEEAVNGVTRGEDRRIQRFKWYFNERKCQQIRSRLQRHREELSNLVGLMQIECLQSFVIDPRDPSAIGCSTKTESIVSKKARLVHRTAEDPDLEFNESTSGIIPINPNQETPQTPVSNHPESDLAVVKLEPQTDRRGSVGCSGRCRCSCHFKYALQWPQSLRRSSSSNAVGFLNSKSYVCRCSAPGCQAGKGLQSQTTYIFPPWLRKKAISISIILHGFRIKRHLRSCNVVAESSDAVRYTIKGDLDGLKRLLSGGSASIHDSTVDGWSLLHCAAYYGRSQVVEFLINNSADVDAAEIKSRKAAHFAMLRALRKGASEDEKLLAKLFPNAEEFISDFQLSPVHIAVLGLYDSSDIERPSLSELLDFVDLAKNAPLGEDWHSWKTSYKDRSPLFREIIEDFERVAQKEKGDSKSFCDLTNRPDAHHGWSPVHWAAFTGRYEEWEILFNHAACLYTLTLSGRNLFHQAAESKNADIMERLIRIAVHDSCLDMNLHDIWQETPLHISAGKSAKCVSLLLENGAKVDALQMDHQVPLHFAQFADGQEKIDIVRILSAVKGEHINVRDSGGRTPIFDLLESQKCVSILLEQGAEANICDNDGKTLLHHACREDQPQSLEIILESVPELASAKDKEGITPIAEAFGRGTAPCVSLLLRQDPIDCHPDKNNWSLIHHAAKLGDGEILEHVISLPKIQRYLYSFTNRGQSATDVAQAAGKYTGKVKELLLELSKAEGMLPDKLAKRAPTKAEIFAIWK